MRECLTTRRETELLESLLITGAANDGISPLRNLNEDMSSANCKCCTKVKYHFN